MVIFDQRSNITMFCSLEMVFRTLRGKIQIMLISSEQKDEVVAVDYREKAQQLFPNFSLEGLVVHVFVLLPSPLQTNMKHDSLSAERYPLASFNWAAFP